MGQKSYDVHKDKLSAFSRRYRWQIIATLTIHILTLAHGIGVGWLSPTLQLLVSWDTPLNAPLTVEEASWVGSLVGLGSLAGNIVFGLLIDRIGRKFCMYLVAIPNALYWILIYTAKDVSYLYAGRFLMGMTSGGIYVVFPIFIAEIADNDIRGGLQSIAMLCILVGLLLGLILASSISYYLMPIIVFILPVIFLVAITGLPETPAYLLRKGRDKDAEKSFRFYKNLAKERWGSEIEQYDMGTQEFNEFREQVLRSGMKENITWPDLSNSTALKAFGLILVLLVCNQISGAFAIFNYTAHILVELGSELDANIGTIIVGASQFIGILSTITLVDRLGRRVLLLTSIGGMGLGELALGLFKDLSSPEVIASANWLTVVLMCWVAIMSALGLNALLFTIITELLPARIRSIGAAISMSTLSALMFVALKIYPLMIFGPGIAATMYMSAGSCALGFVILGLFMPETKGKLMTD